MFNRGILLGQLFRDKVVGLGYMIDFFFIFESWGVALFLFLKGLGSKETEISFFQVRPVVMVGSCF